MDNKNKKIHNYIIQNTLTEKYGIIGKNGIYTEESMKIISDKMNELYITSPWKEMIQEYENKNNPIISSGHKFLEKNNEEDSYVMNSNGEKYYSTLSPSRKAIYEFTDDNKYNFYETYSMTKYNATNRITMVLNYKGTFEYIELVHHID